VNFSNKQLAKSFEFTREKQKENPKIIVQNTTKFVQKMVMDWC
jgi:hypothetical protein